MDRFEHYSWPFFEDRHRTLAAEADAWIKGNSKEEENADSVCKYFVKELGKSGFLKHCVSATPDVRAIALLREVFAYHHGLADFAFVMQGLGSGPIMLAGTEAQKKRWLDVFRTTVAGAALGFARRALAEALARAKDRKMFGARLADLQMTQAKLADMATGIEAAALLAYRAGWLRDVKNKRITREAAMAKMQATEMAQQVGDAAVQILGGLGVKSGHPVERLYREVRALRIYKGATEMQTVIIARELLRW